MGGIWVKSLNIYGIIIKKRGDPLNENQFRKSLITREIEGSAMVLYFLQKIFSGRKNSDISLLGI